MKTKVFNNIIICNKIINLDIKNIIQSNINNEEKPVSNNINKDKTNNNQTSNNQQSNIQGQNKILQQNIPFPCKICIYKLLSIRFLCFRFILVK